MIKTNSFRQWLVLILVAVFIGGCSWFDRPDPYKQSADTNPLSVPEDLSSPTNETALLVPELQTSNVAPADSSMPPRLARGARRNNSAEDKTSAFLEYEGDQFSLVVVDSRSGTWRRVRFALERSGAELLSENEAESVYSVRYLSTRAVAEEPGFFSRLILRKKTETPVERLFQVKISEDGERTRVKLLDSQGYTDTGEDAEELLIKLADRLG